MKFTTEQENQIGEVLTWLTQAGAIKWRKGTPEELIKEESEAVGVLVMRLTQCYDGDGILTMDDDHSNFATEGYNGIGIDVSLEPFEAVLGTLESA